MKALSKLHHDFFKTWLHTPLSVVSLVLFFLSLFSLYLFTFGYLSPRSLFMNGQSRSNSSIERLPASSSNVPSQQVPGPVLQGPSVVQQRVQPGRAALPPTDGKQHASQAMDTKLQPLQQETKVPGVLQRVQQLSLEEEEDWGLEPMVRLPSPPPRLTRQTGVYLPCLTSERRLGVCGLCMNCLHARLLRRSMKRKLDMIPVTRPSLYLDTLQGRVSTAQATSTWFTGGNLTGQNSFNTGADASPDCWSGMSFVAANNDGSTGNVYGRSTTMIHSWEV